MEGEKEFGGKKKKADRRGKESQMIKLQKGTRNEMQRNRESLCHYRIQTLTKTMQQVNMFHLGRL